MANKSHITTDLINYQYTEKIFEYHDELQKILKNKLQRYDIALDAFLLGYMAGKQDDRARRRINRQKSNH